MFEDLYTYISQSEQLNDEFEKTDLDRFIFHFKGLESFSFFELPTTYIIDYRTGDYIFVSKSVKKLLGYEPDFFSECAVFGAVELIKKEDATIVTSRCFPEIIKFLQEVPYTEHKKYIFTTNYRVRDKSKNYIHLSQKNIYLNSTEDRKPIIGIGMLSPLQQDSKSRPIYMNIQSNIKEYSFIPNKSIDSKCFLPDHESWRFTRQEFEIVKWIAEGLSSKQIADKLNRSILTIKKHRTNILHKTNCKNTAELIAYVLKEKIL